MKSGLIVLVVGFCLLVQAAEKGAAPGKSRGPVDIRSDRLTVLQKQHQAVFSGQVHAVQGDLEIRCERLTVTYADPDDKQNSSGEIRRMVFEGQVAIVQSKRRGHCRRAEYDRRKGLIVCTGDPWVVEGENRIDGDRIEYHLDRDEVRVTRPRARLRLEERAGRNGG